MKHKLLIFGLSLSMIAFFTLTGCKKKDNVPLLTTTEITNITFKTATSGGTITNDGGSDVTSTGVCWSLKRNPTIENFTSTSDSTMDFYSCNITGLTESTEYYVRAFATNGEGTGYGNEIPFTTNIAPEFSFSYDIEDITNVPTLIDVTDVFDEIHIKTQIENTILTVVLPADFTTGQHPLGTGTEYEALFDNGNSQVYYSSTGTIDITNYDPVTLKLNGVFEFTGEEITGGGTIHITNGEFEVYY